MSLFSSSDFNKKPKKVNKYRAVKTVHDGKKFDSRKEAVRYGELKLLKLAGKIKDFECQVKYKLEVNGYLICEYIADFVVYHNNGTVDVEDVKSIITAKLPVFRLKEKLMLAIHGIKIKKII